MEKDIDGISDGSLAAVVFGKEQGFPPCTAQSRDFRPVQRKAAWNFLIITKLIVREKKQQ